MDIRCSVKHNLGVWPYTYIYRCILTSEHNGPHRDSKGNEWVFKEVKKDKQESRLELLCAHCGQVTKGSASVDGRPVCHPDEPAYPDCYRLITVYGEPIGARVVPLIYAETC